MLLKLDVLETTTPIFRAMGSQRKTAVTVHSSGSVPSTSYKKARAPTDTSLFLEDILEEGEKLVAHPGTSQYSIGGVSTCGLASLNFARLLFDKEREGVRGAALLGDIGLVQSVEVSRASQHFLS